VAAEIPIACSLPDAELRKREATLLAQFKSAVISTEELPNGYAFCVPGDEKRIAVVMNLIAAERECCPFLTFELIFQPDSGPIIMRVTGPAGARDFLKGILV
jgi:hypothetical protein